MTALTGQAVPCVCPAGCIDVLLTDREGRTDINKVGTHQLELEMVR